MTTDQVARFSGIEATFILRTVCEVDRNHLITAVPFFTMLQCRPDICVPFRSSTSLPNYAEVTFLTVNVGTVGTFRYVTHSLTATESVLL
jgi:hypothetical protein